MTLHITLLKLLGPDNAIAIARQHDGEHISAARLEQMAKRKLAESLLQKNVSLSLVAERTGYSVRHIARIKKDMSLT